MTRASPAQLSAYFARIGFKRVPGVDLETLTELHRCHAEQIAWESIDCYIGRPTGCDPRDAFDKIVREGRGGWCFEMNGLLGWMLESIGFRVTRLAAGVMREQLGDDVLGNHLALLVHLDRDYVADVGIGSALIEPIPLAEGVYRQRYAEFRLERLDGHWWRFHNQAGAMPPSFDFAADLTDEALLEKGCCWLQSNPDSPFRRDVVIQRHGPHGLDSLINASRMRLADGNLQERSLGAADDYAAELRDGFGLSVPDVPVIWARLSESAPARD